MLMPKRVKYRKQMRGRMKGKAQRGVDVSFGDYGLKSLECGYLTARQIEAACRAIVHELLRRGVDPCIPGQTLHQARRRNPHG